jgi:hypothetical protein
MTLPVGSFLIGVACFGLASAYQIRFSERLTVPTAAALAPMVAWLGTALMRGGRWYLLIIAPITAGLFQVASRQGLSLVSFHALFFGLSVLVSVTGWRLGVRSALLPALVASALYLAGDYARQQFVTPTNSPSVRADKRTWWLLQAVLICACGLTVLAVERMDWPAFVAMAGVLVLTKREFEAFALSRAAYVQTMRAIDVLKRLEVPTSRSAD